MQRGAVSGVVQRFLAFIDAQSLTGCRVGIAFSGGRDSSALAICAMEARNAGRLAPFLVHVDHGVRSDSAEDRAIVKESADRLNTDLLTVELDSLSTHSTEAEMRQARYAALHQVLAPLGVDTVLTGHHARDQAETVLLHLARGQGLEGATGMSPLETLVFDDVQLCVVRSFLNEDPVALADLVAAYGLPVVDDPTNELVDRARNLVRHQVLPVLCDINPGVVINIARSTQILRDENALLSSIVESRISRLASFENLDGVQLSGEPIAIQRRIIRLWVKQTTGLELTFDRTEAVRELAVTGTGNVVLEIGEGWTARQDKRQITLRRTG